MWSIIYLCLNCLKDVEIVSLPDTYMMTYVTILLDLVCRVTRRQTSSQSSQCLSMGWMAESHCFPNAAQCMRENCTIPIEGLQPKSGRDPDWAALSHTRLAVLRWCTETPERVPATAGKFERHTTSIDWSTESLLPCDRGIIKNTVPPRYLRTTAKALFIEKNVTQKFLGHPTLLLFHCARSSVTD